MPTSKYDRESILDGIKDAWDLVPDLPFGLLIAYVMEQEDPSSVGDEELMTYINDFVMNNM